jgi:hypothetical protein
MRRSSALDVGDVGSGAAFAARMTDDDGRYVED